MGLRTSIALFGAAALLFLVGVRANEIGPALVALFLGGAGAAGLISAAARNRRLPPADANPIEARLQQFEQRLQLTEDELAATVRELASLREVRDFDRQLQGGQTRAIPPGGQARESADPA